MPKIDYPWIKNGEVSFIPTRVKWIESLANKQAKKRDVVEKEENNE